MTDDAYQEPPDPVLDFIAERHSEEEAAARESYYEGQRWITEEEGVYRWPADELVHMADRKSDARFIARNDPARALRRVEAGRALVAAYERSVRAVGVGLSQDLRRPLLAHAAIWSDDPGYDPAWT
jgi:hypothetical protein